MCFNRICFPLHYLAYCQIVHQFLGFLFNPGQYVLYTDDSADIDFNRIAKTLLKI